MDSSAVKPEGKNADKDRRAREALRRQFDSRRFTASLDASGALPGFGAADARGSMEAVYGPSVSDLDVVGEKVLRGSVWFMQRRFLTDVEVMTFCCDEYPEEIEKARGAQMLSIFPGIAIFLATVPKRPDATIGIVELWARLRMVVISVPRLLLPLLADQRLPDGHTATTT